MESFIQDWGYIALFLYSFGGGMLALAIGAVFASSGDLNIGFVIAIASISNFIGDQFLFTLARNNKQYAKDMMQKHKRKIAYSHLLMRKYGVFVIFIQKYLYGVKTLVPLAMGLTKYEIKKFIVYNFFASIVWGLIVGLIAFSLGRIFIDSLDEMKEYGLLFLVVIFIALYFFYKKK